MGNPVRRLQPIVSGILIVLLFLLATGAAQAAPGAPGDENWGSQFGGPPGTDDEVRAIVVNGTSGDVYVGGMFLTAGGVRANGIARWNGSAWSALGSGVNGNVLALALHGTNLYAAGKFTTAGGQAANLVARYDLATQTWSALGGGLGGDQWANVYALAVVGNDLYAGGTFSTATDPDGVKTVNGLARWNPATGRWSAVGGGTSTSGQVYALAAAGAQLYVAGSFTSVYDTPGSAAIPATRIARWDTGTNTWSTLAGGLGAGYEAVRALAVAGNDLYAGGDFTLARNSGGNITANRIARWNSVAATWSALGSGISVGEWPEVASIAVDGSTVYVGGDFGMAGTSAVHGLAAWNGSAWAAVGTGAGPGGIAYPGVEVLALRQGNLLAGGTFTAMAGVPAGYIAAWTGTGWAALGPGTGNAPGGWLRAVVAAPGGGLYVGGNFTIAGSVPANYVARWNGSAWSALGEGVNGYVWAIAVDGSDVYVGGDFTRAGPANASNIARWDGSSWHALGSGTNGRVFALAVLGDYVYAGGEFAAAGGVASTKSLARWSKTGQTWSPVGGSLSGSSPSVSALAVGGDTLYVGGSFSDVLNSPGGAEVSAYNVARWDATTSTWSSLGQVGGVFNGSVQALAVDGVKVYAAGDFNQVHDAGGYTTANRVAVWNATTGRWSALGSGLEGPEYGAVGYALAVVGSDLIVGGNFPTAGGQSANNIARWSPAANSWSTLGSGALPAGSPGRTVAAMASRGTDLYAGGDLVLAGGKSSFRLAQWSNCPGCVPRIFLPMSRR